MLIGYRVLFLLLVVLASANATIHAQSAGSRGGVGSTSHTVPRPEMLDSEVATGYIAIDGQVELRVKPTEIRVVLAVTAESETPGNCRKQVQEQIESLTAAWKKMGIPDDDIVEDFISVLPRYEYEIQKSQDREVAMEKKTGYLMQTNLHLAVDDDAQAMRAINLAFDLGVADIIAFDYGSKELDSIKIKARAAAVKAAREKSELLLGALFDDRPPVINVQESTQVVYPASQYESFSNSSDDEYRATFSRRDIPQIQTFRPRNTYYRGVKLDADVQPRELPMRPEISVVSTVRLYFESPTTRRSGQEGDKD